MSTYPIDIVIPWVDGSDPVWQADHAKYRASKSADDHPARYREWGLFRYWFRGIEQNAPWVRKVHLLTYGHLPAWLEPDHPKLHIVNHRDFIPEEYLPTFSSHTIELNMHRIPDLAEHFLYFNDDVYLMKPSRPEDFFRDGLPCDTAVMGVIKNNDTANFMPYIMLNMMALVNMSFDKRSVIRQNFGKWFYPGYGKGLLYNLYLLPWGDFTGFRNYHSCVSFCKSTLEEVWDRFPEVLDATSYIQREGGGAQVWSGAGDNYDGEYFCFRNNAYIGTWDGQGLFPASACAAGGAGVPIPANVPALGDATRGVLVLMLALLAVMALRRR